jgi:hypothetical protein
MSTETTETNTDLEHQIKEVAAEQEAQEAQEPVEEPQDADHAEWLAARAAAEAAEKGEDPEPEAEPEEKADEAPAEPPQGEPVEPEPAEGKKQPPAMIPKPRFDEVRGRLSKAEQAAIYWKGVAEGRIQQQGQTPKQEEEAPAPDPVADLEAEQEALAKRYDDGDISMTEFTQENRRLTRELAKAEAAHTPTEDADPKQSDFSGNLAVQSAYREIAKANPWLSQPTKGLQEGLRADLEDLNDRAHELARSEGISIDTRTEQGVVLHRAFLIAAAHEAGLPQRYGWTPPAEEPEQPPQSQSGRQRSNPKPGAPTPDQRRQKVALRNSLPGDPTQAGVAGTPGQEPSAAEIANMNEDEIAALPESIKAKYRG